eukprot:10540703-Alexandrium_andersonii.AAC.1
MSLRGGAPASSTRGAVALARGARCRCGRAPHRHFAARPTLGGAPAGGLGPGTLPAPAPGARCRLL